MDDLKIGDLVWAKLKGYPWWPGKIKDIETCPGLKRPKAASGFPIYFYGSHDFQWILKSDLKSYQTHYKTYVGLAASKLFKKAVEEANHPETAIELSFAHDQIEEQGLEMTQEQEEEREDVQEEKEKEREKEKEKRPKQKASDSSRDSATSESLTEEKEKNTAQKNKPFKTKAQPLPPTSAKRQKTGSEMTKAATIMATENAETMIEPPVAKPKRKSTAHGSEIPLVDPSLRLLSPLSLKASSLASTTAVEDKYAQRPEYFANEEKLLRYRVKLQRSCLTETIKHESLSVANEILQKLLYAKVSQEDLLKTKIGVVIKRIAKLPFDDEQSFFLSSKAQQLMERWMSMLNSEACSTVADGPSPMSPTLLKSQSTFSPSSPTIAATATNSSSISSPSSLVSPIEPQKAATATASAVKDTFHGS